MSQQHRCIEEAHIIYLEVCVQLQQVCGHEYISKLLRMFNDVTISTDLTSQFGAFSQQLSLAFNVTILQVGDRVAKHFNILYFQQIRIST